MKREIVHILNGVSLDGRFGGVQTAALALARQQHEEGQSVKVLAGRVGFRSKRIRIDTVDILTMRTFLLSHRLGYGTLFAPSLCIHLIQNFRKSAIYHVHLGRDLITLPATLLLLLAGKIVVAQTHGMLDPPANRASRVIDALFLKFLARRIETFFVLTESERDLIESAASRDVDIRYLKNGIVAPRLPMTDRARNTNILFLARLHPRKHAAQFARAAVELAPILPDFTFIIAGPDEGDLDAVKQTLSTDTTKRVSIVGAQSHEAAVRLYQAAALYVLPAPEEPFGLTILEALAEGTPVIVHKTAALAPLIVANGAGWTCDDFDLADVIISALSDRSGLRLASENGVRLSHKEFSMKDVSKAVQESYSKHASR